MIFESIVWLCCESSLYVWISWSLKEWWAVLWTRLFWAVRTLDCWASRRWPKTAQRGEGSTAGQRGTEGVKGKHWIGNQNGQQMWERWAKSKKRIIWDSPRMQTMCRYLFTVVNWQVATAKSVGFQWKDRRQKISYRLKCAGGETFSSGLLRFVTLAQWWESRTIRGLKVGIERISRLSDYFTSRESQETAASVS